MMNFLKKIFMKAPFFIKRLMINLEAYRRDLFRRYGAYGKLLMETDMEAIMRSGCKDEQEKRFLELLSCAKQNVPRYQDIEVVPLQRIETLPVLTKSDLISDIDVCISREINKKKCFRGITSGSTGTPLTYYHSKEGTRNNQLYADRLLELCGLLRTDRKVRISGVNIVPFKRNRPPFWVYISKYRQLQCSAYHISEKTCRDYIEAMKRCRVSFGTGYAAAWYHLSEFLLKEGGFPPLLKAIVTDSEGITKEQQKIVEKAFCCPVYQTYGLSEIGQAAFQCRNGNYHIVPLVCIAETVDENYKAVKTGEPGQILLTSLLDCQTPFIRYATGDIGVLGRSPCGCGWDTPYFESICGRVDDCVVTADGRKIGRLSHVIKEGVGLRESQLVQTDPRHLSIRVVPGEGFCARSMDRVTEHAKNYLGDMDITWETVSDLEKTKNGKVRYVIRKF